jgi:probable rRNA maturation factor
MPDPIINVEVLVEDRAWRSVPGIKALAVRAATSALTYGLPPRQRAAVCVALIDDEAIARLNHDFRGLPKPTDVLSFPQLPGKVRAVAARLAKWQPRREAVSLGDIVIAYGACVKGAREEKIPLTDHLAHLVAHGALHLLGHDHSVESETKRMRKIETAVLAEIDVADPWAATLRDKSKRKSTKGSRR